MLCVSDFSVASAKTDGKNPLKSTELKKHFMEDVYKPGQKHCRDDVMRTAKTNKKNCRSQERLLPAPSFFGRFPDRASTVGRAHAPVPRRAGIVPPSPGAAAEPKPPATDRANHQLYRYKKKQLHRHRCVLAWNTRYGQGNECTARVSRDS